MELTVTEALVKLKLANKKLEDSANKVTLGYVSSKGAKTVPAGYANVDEFKKEVQSKLESVQGLMVFRDRLKKAVVESNAKTVVTVASETMSVAEAIERKQAVKFRKEYVARLEVGYNQLTSQVDKNNASLDVRADEFLVKVFGTNPVAEQDKQSARKNFVELNTCYVVGYDGMRSHIDKMKKSIEDFESNVDSALSVVNAKTLVNILD